MGRLRRDRPARLRAVALTGGFAFFVLAFFVLERVTLADEPRLPAEPRLMREPGEPVTVADAADEDDPIDVELGLLYHLDIERATIRRADLDEDVATYTHVVSRLEPQVQVGLWHDLAFSGRLLLALSDARRLSRPTGAPSDVTAGGDTLFSLPLKSPERSGVDRFALGLAYAPLSQARDRRMPNLKLGLEAQISIGTPVAACNQAPAEGQVRCAHPGDVDRDGVIDADEPDGGAELDPGYARSSVALRAEIVSSGRVRYVEPFGGLEATVELPLSDSPLVAYAPNGDAELPPVEGLATVGLGVVPWENRERFSRVWLDVRGFGGFVTRGPDTTPLFDALGASASRALRSPVGGRGPRAYETGVTVVDAHGALGARTSFAWRASQLIQLGFDLAVRHDFAHDIVVDAPGSSSYRAVLGDVGLREVGAIRFELAAGGKVMF